MKTPHEKALNKKKNKSGWEQKGGINENGAYCNHCASKEHKSPAHAGLVRSGKLSR